MMTKAIGGVLRGALAPYVAVAVVVYSVYELGRIDGADEENQKWRAFDKMRVEREMKASMN